MLCTIDRSAPSTNGAAISMDLLSVQSSINCTAPSVITLGQAGPIGMGQFVRFIVASTIRVRWGTIQV